MWIKDIDFHSCPFPFGSQRINHISLLILTRGLWVGSLSLTLSNLLATGISVWFSPFSLSSLLHHRGYYSLWWGKCIQSQGVSLWFRLSQPSDFSDWEQVSSCLRVFGLLCNVNFYYIVRFLPCFTSWFEYLYSLEVTLSDHYGLWCSVVFCFFWEKRNIPETLILTGQRVAQVLK